MSPDLDHQLRQILADVLGLKPAAVAAFDADTGLFGHLLALVGQHRLDREARDHFAHHALGGHAHHVFGVAHVKQVL